jgi:hypothetical protein
MANKEFAKQVAALLRDSQEDRYYAAKAAIIKHFGFEPTAAQMNAYFFTEFEPYHRALYELNEEHQRLLDALNVLNGAVQ